MHIHADPDTYSWSKQNAITIPATFLPHNHTWPSCPAGRGSHHRTLSAWNRATQSITTLTLTKRVSTITVLLQVFNWVERMSLALDYEDEDEDPISTCEY